MPDDPNIRELADIPSAEVISRAAVMLMSAGAEKLGLAAPDPPAVNTSIWTRPGA